MKPERAFVAERIAAVHCPELLGKPAPAPDALLPRLSLAGQAFAKALATALAAFVGGEAPILAAGEAQRLDHTALCSEIGPLAANSLFCLGAVEAPILVCLDAGALLGMVERTFGGRGRVPDPLPESLPLSAELMMARLEAVSCACLAAALGLPDAESLSCTRRSGSVVALAAFADDAPLAAVRIDVTEPGRLAWPLFIAVAEAALPALVGDKAHASPKRIRGRADPMSEPFASLPLSLRAVLVDMAVPMARLAALEVGQILPVTVARHVPLKLGGKTVASGTVGAADDCIAIRITQSRATLAAA